MTPTRSGKGGGAGPSPPTQLLMKEADRLAGNQVLVIGAPRDSGVAELFGGRQGTLVTFDYSAYRLHEQLLSAPGMRLKPQFTARYAPGRVHDVAVMYLQKGSDLNHLMAAMASQAIRPGGVVFLVGENKAGIRSAAEIVERRVGPISSSNSARHCVLYEAQVDATRAGPVDLGQWEREFAVAAGGRTVTLVSLPGVFSHGRLDDGTRFLLGHLPRDLGGAVLDFGCGSGVLGAVVKTRHPECEITLVDANAFAVESAVRTFERNGLSFRHAGPADGFDGVGGEFDRIISNPPFHQGIATNYEIVSAFLAQCDRRLRPGGRLILVANKFLPYEGLMLRVMNPPSMVAQNEKYKVLSSTKRG